MMTPAEPAASAAPGQPVPGDSTSGEPVRGRARSGAARRNPTPKAGGDLPAAVGVGLAMLFAVLGGLLLLPLGFVLLTTAFAVFGVWEIYKALHGRGTTMPIIPVMTGTVAV